MIAPKLPNLSFTTVDVVNETERRSLDPDPVWLETLPSDVREEIGALLSAGVGS